MSQLLTRVGREIAAAGPYSEPQTGAPLFSAEEVVSRLERRISVADASSGKVERKDNAAEEDELPNGGLLTLRERLWLQRPVSPAQGPVRCVLRRRSLTDYDFFVDAVGGVLVAGSGIVMRASKIPKGFIGAHKGSLLIYVGADDVGSLANGGGGGGGGGDGDRNPIAALRPVSGTAAYSLDYMGSGAGTDALAAILLSPDPIQASKGVRSATVCLPDVGNERHLSVWRTDEALMVESAAQGCFDGMVQLRSVPATWVDHRYGGEDVSPGGNGNYEVPCCFGADGPSEPSQKTLQLALPDGQQVFQLHKNTHPRTVTREMRKYGDPRNAFFVEFAAPMSPLHAFAVAITSVGDRTQLSCARLTKRSFLFHHINSRPPLTMCCIFNPHLQLAGNLYHQKCPRSRRPPSYS